MIEQTVKVTSRFYAILGCFIISYFFFLLLTSDGNYLSVLKISYTLTLGELDFEDLNTTKFLIFVVFTTFIALFLMNLLIAILSDAYELVTSEKKYYNSKAQLHRSLSYERLETFIRRLF